MEATPSTWNFGSTGPRWSEIADFQPIFARSTLAVTPSKRSSINTNRKSTTHFPMSLRWSSYGAPKPPGGAHKCKTVDFRVKSHFAWRKSATKFLCMKTVSGKVVRHSLAYQCKNYQWGMSPSPWNFGSNWPRYSEIADFWSLFTRSDSAVTPSEKSSMNTNKKCFPVSPRWTLYIVSTPPKEGLKNAKCPKFEQ